MGSIMDEYHTNRDGFSTSKIVGLVSGKVTTPTGIKEEVVLLSWLIVLLRTYGYDDARLNWSYKCRGNGGESESLVGCLSKNEVMTGLKDNVGQVSSAIASHIATVAPNQRVCEASSVSILLGTNTQSQKPIDAAVKDALRLDIHLEDDHLVICPVCETENATPYTVTRHIETLVDTIKMCTHNPDASIKDCLRPTRRDLDDIWGWNYRLPPAYNFCMHEMVSERARISPDKEAIWSWDGKLTYAQVDQYSRVVAFLLREMGAKVHEVLPVCFEKSKWTTVAMLGVMKAGATFVLMDPTLPLARLQNVAGQVDANLMLTSRKQYAMSTSILPNGKHFVVEEDTFTHSPNLLSVPELPGVPTSALMYIIFTSGSTGNPKGVKISHDTYSSSAVPRGKAVGYTEGSRVLDFASYAFDVSIDSMLLTLVNGGCLCIPSDEDRMNDINGVIRKMGVNYAGLTPSLARILEPDVISSLSGLGLGGEAVSARDVAVWGKDTRIIIGYGPCECTIGCTINSSAATGRDYISIGKGNGAAVWIADPNDHDSLTPVGAVGELLVEGPIVGQGYLNDPEKTASAFIEDPSWLIAGHDGYPGRRGRLYKTGDLAKYDPDGSGGIVFVGRKDTQVKLRGQRIELGEIESQLRARLPSKVAVIAEVIVPLWSGGQPTLMAFIAFQASKEHEHAELVSGRLPEELDRALAKANADVAEVLPRYMMPTAYVPVNYIPVLISGKTDRRRLKEFGATVDLQQLDQGTTNHTARPLSNLEHRLRQAWSHVLKLDSESISAGDNFFALGGDSLTAMRLVSVCRAQDLDLTVASTFSYPTIAKMANVVGKCNKQAETEAPSFSMIHQSVDSACVEAAHACGSRPEAVEDIYPCTPTQESLFTFSIKSAKAYVAQRLACIPAHISLDIWKKAWEDVVAASPIMRTRLAHLQDPGLQQVVLKENISWRHSTDLAEYLENDRNEKMDLGQSLARYAIVDHPRNGKRYMVWTVHHVLYDGWSEPLVFEKVSDALQGHQVEIPGHIRDFVKYVRNTDDIAMQEFWRRELKGAVGPQFPHLPSRDYLPTPDAMVEHHVSFDAGAASPFTTATLIRGAWALVASEYTGSNDVVFGETLTGRDIPLPGVESIVGPLIATLPVRIHTHRKTSVGSYLQSIQREMLERTPYQHMGMQNIRKVSQDAQHACEAGTGLVIQPESAHDSSELGFQHEDVVREALHFNPYPLMLACGIRKGGFKVCASFDSALVEAEQMERILVQLETACLQLTKDFSRSVGEISCLPDQELDQIWQWNQEPPLSFDESSMRLRANPKTKHGSFYPQAVIPWVCNTQNPALLSPIGCVGELWLEGAFFSGESTESPSWLTAGSSICGGRTGRVQPTGDMVQLRGDGRLTFVCRKENVIPFEGYAVNIADIEIHLTDSLPPTTRSAVTVSQSPSDNGHNVPEKDLIAFIEHQMSEADGVRVMPETHPIACDDFKTTIRAVVPVDLAVALKKLDKFMHGSLPSYMVPSAYVVVGKISNDISHIDHHLLNKLASKVPQHVLAQLREGFRAAFSKGTVEEELSVPESILRTAWAKILRINQEQIDVGDNFFRLGGDSVLAMRLVSSLRAQGHSLTVADIFQNMRLGDAARVLKLGERPNVKVEVRRPFSMMSNLDIEQFLSGIVRPKLANPHWFIRDVYPVTDSQALDIRGTIQAPRTSIQYTMLYLDRDVDPNRLSCACNDLVKSHDILRTVFIEHNSEFFQVVLDHLEIPLNMRQTDKNLEKYVTGICTEDIESTFDMGSSFLKMLYVEDKDGQKCLIIGLSHAQYDGFSLPMLLRDLATLYTGGEIIDYVPFSSYMAQIRDVHTQSRAISYWRDILNGSSLSVLPGPPVQHTDRSIFQTKRTGISRPPGEITTANLLTAAWALVLARRLAKSDVTFGSVTSGRNIDATSLENVMGPCYQLTPVRVRFERQWTAMDLLRFVQKQSVESATHDFLGFDRISKQCTQWLSEARSFDSLIHHQDFEDFDTMPFAGGTCRVEILKPHGDGAHPLKVVSFVQGGQIHVGVVGSEREPAFVDAALDELATTVQELTTRPSEHIG